jgi:hypothetical protein
MFKEVMNDLWLTRISSLSNEVGLYVVLLEMLLCMPNGILHQNFDFSTLYTTLPHDKLKTRLKETIHKAFSHRNYGSKCVVLGYNSTYFSR